MNTEKIAKLVANESISPSGARLIDYVGISMIEEFLRCCLVRIGGGLEPFAILFQHDETGKTTSIEAYKSDEFAKMNPHWSPIKPLYATPAEAALAAEKRVVEACAKMCAEYGSKNPQFQATVIERMTADDIATCLRAGKWRTHL